MSDELKGVIDQFVGEDKPTPWIDYTGTPRCKRDCPFFREDSPGERCSKSPMPVEVDNPCFYYLFVENRSLNADVERNHKEINELTVKLAEALQQVGEWAGKYGKLAAKSDAALAEIPNLEYDEFHCPHCRDVKGILRGDNHDFPAWIVGAIIGDGKEMPVHLAILEVFFDENAAKDRHESIKLGPCENHFMYQLWCNRGVLKLPRRVDGAQEDAINLDRKQ